MPRRRRVVKGSIKCPKCDRTFGMAAHLARHMNAMHASPQARGAAKRKRRAGGRKRRAKAMNGRRTGGGVVAAMANLTLEELSRLIVSARTHARRKIAEFRRAMK